LFLILAAPFPNQSTALPLPEAGRFALPFLSLSHHSHCNARRLALHRGRAFLFVQEALGLDAAIGSIEIGKQTDLIAVRTDTPRMTPLLTGADGNLHHNLVHAVQGGDVDLTMIAGKIDVEKGQLLTADLHELIADANAAVPDLFRRRAEWLATHQPVNEYRKWRLGT
jgi:hypothetical protein